MTRFLFISFVFLSFVGYSQSYKSISQPTEIKKKINEKTKSTKSISANFKEEIHSAMFNAPKIGAGKLKYKKSGKIRWEHTSPKKQIVLINNGKTRMLDNGKEVTNSASNRIVKKVQSLMMSLFSGDFLNEKEFNITYYSSDKNYKLVLKPKSSRMAKYIEKIDMVFTKKDLTLKQLILHESETDKMQYTFSQVLMDAPISDTHFTKF